jgi:hypothetical protein
MRQQPAVAALATALWFGASTAVPTAVPTAGQTPAAAAAAAPAAPAAGAAAPGTAPQDPVSPLRETVAGGARTASLGQPATLRWTAAAAAGHSDHPFGLAAVGVQRDLMNPLLGAAAIHAEAYARGGGGSLSPGLRARLVSPLARTAVGADVQAGEGADLLLSVFHPVRRGGLFRDGSQLRLDYLPGRAHSVSLGVEKPVLARTRIGRSRPRRDHVLLPAGAWPAAGPPPPALAQPLAELRHAVRGVRLTTLPLGPVPLKRATDSALVAAELQPVLQELAQRDAGGPETEVRRYHLALERAFDIAAGLDGATGFDGAAELAAAARRVLLEEVLLPYNRLLGQTRRPDQLAGLAVPARAAFGAWLERHGAVPPGRHAVIRRVFDELLTCVEADRAAARKQWGDDRFVWLPLQLALLPEEHATQEQIDALIETAVGVPFTAGNFVSYLVNEQFQYHLSRTIREAAEYHVLWTHDFRGVDAGGDIDEMSFRHVVGSYLAALTRRVQEYDRTGVLPTYMIVIDQWFYEVNRGRLWLTLLEDPLRHRVALPATHAQWQDSIDAAQHSLREAVAASALLQERARRYGDAWLRDLVKVHVNVTNPADPSFWSTRVVRGLPLPDNMMRDHRKLVFYDITEEDPYRGEAIFTGAGVGEHYANLSWEDRSLLVRGPALLPLKAVTRELLVNQGIPRERVPRVLLPLPLAVDYAERVQHAAQRNQQPLRALQLHSGAGFADKQVNVAKAILYTLMPPGSVLKIPDSLWNSEFWASALLGCALRGGRVLIVAPAAENAPADAFGTLGRSRETLTRLLVARGLLRRELSEAGGVLGVGLFRSSQPVNDIPAKVRLTQQAFASSDWLRELFGLQPSVLAELATLAAEIEHLSMSPDGVAEFEYDPLPKLHLKANFFASPEAWTLMTRPEWSSAAWAYMQIRVSQLQSRAASIGTFAAFPEAIADVGGGMVRDWHASLDPHTAGRVVFYSLMGSHNQNNRSMVIDAETGFLMSGWPAIIPHIDFIVLIGQTTWLDDAAELAPLLPLETGLRRRLAHWFRLTL